MASLLFENRNTGYRNITRYLAVQLRSVAFCTEDKADVGRH